MIMNQYINLYFDNKNNRFSLFIDEAEKIHFAYWHELKKHDIRHLLDGQKFEAELSENQDLHHSRGVKIAAINTIENDLIYKTKIIQGDTITSDNFKNLTSQNQHLVFINCKFDDLDIHEFNIANSLAIIDSEFLGNFRLLSSKIDGDLWMPNCRFNKHFSLKSSEINGSIHLEGADFSGAGGASFRGVNAQNIYLDLGVQGGNDLFWLNEMTVPGVVVIGGDFKNEVQILLQQDKNENANLSKKECVGSVIIGVELYEFENANKTNIKSGLKIDGITINEHLHIKHLDTDRLTISNVAAQKIDINGVSVNTDLEISNCTSNAKSCVNSNGSIFLKCSSVGRHLKINNNKFDTCNLSGTAVSEVTYFENNTLGEVASINLNRFTTSRFLIHPANFLYGNSRMGVFKAKSFAVLSAKNNLELGNQYCSLKHWLTDSGNLKLEDVAFFNMQQCFNDNKLTKFVFGGVFGWGVRLSNIALSSMVLISLFAAIYFYLIPDISVIKAVSLSTQSFISSFFGKWDDYAPEGVISSIVTFESLVGILFITVFIGSYIRKLLR